MAPVAAGAPFGFGMVLVFLSVFNYLIDSYTIYAASVLAANSLLRSIFGAVFPLFTTYMYHDLGIHWASSIPAFLSLACVPFPFIFYKYGAQIRERCTFAAEAEAFMQRLSEQKPPEPQRQESLKEKPDTEAGTNASDDSSDSRSEALSTLPSRASIARHASRASRRSANSAVQYEENPYDIDRVHTRQSAISGNHEKD
jgi:hypothetical protein